MRTDTHAAASATFDPEAYTFVDCFDTHEEEGDHKARREAVSHLVQQGYKFGHGSSNKCGHCGSHIRYAALMARSDVMEFIFIGEQCLDNRFELSKREFQMLRKTAKLNRERTTRLERFEQTKNDNPWLVEYAHSDLVDTFLSSLLHQAESGKTLTERQIEAGEAALAKAKQWKAEYELAQANSVPAPEGKVTVRGEVKSMKWQENGFGSQLKMLVLADEGFKVWTTVPSSLQGVETLVDGEWIVTAGLQVGERVEFTATLTRSNDDKAFAFAKRPTKAINLTKS